MNLKLLLGCCVIFETLASALCNCPYNCIVCLNAVIICNKWKEEQQLSGKYTIETLNAGAFENAGIVTLLDVSHSSIHTIENGAFEGLDSIKTLDLSNNDITALQNTVFAPLSTLEDLDISYNSIQTLEVNALDGLKNLKTLDLSHNEISFLPDGSFESLTNLETLDLSYNKIEVLNPNTFKGLGNLTKLHLDHNSLSSLTSNNFLEYLPSLQEIKMSSNDWNCDCNITNVIHIINTINVISESNVQCATPMELKDSIISELDLYAQPLSCYEAVPSPSPSPSPLVFSLSSPIQPSPSPLPFLVSPSPTIVSVLSSSTLSSSSSSFTISPSSSSSSSSSFTIPPSSSSSISISPSSSSSSSSTFVQPTPSCLSTIIESSIGITEWGDTQSGQSSTFPCPYGPVSGHAIRLCLTMPDNRAVWGDVQDGGCFTATNFLQNLVNGVTKENAVVYSSQLLLLPFNHLTQTDISLLVDLSLLLTSVAGNDLGVLINVFAAIDLALEGSKGKPLSPESSKELQDVINSALFKIVSSGNQEVVVDLANFFLGGKNIENTDRVTAVVVLTGDDAGLQFVRNGTAVPPARDIEVEYNKESSTDVHVLQITVYTNNTLYTEGCVENSDVCNGEVVTPVTVVHTDDGNVGSVNITFEVNVNETGKCALWNSTLNNGNGEWEFSPCKTSVLSPEKVLCECQFIGVIALIKVPNITSPLPTSNTSEIGAPLAIQISFSAACGVSAILHLPVIIASFIICCRYDFVRNIQALINQALAQSLVFIVMAVSYQNIEVYEACLGLGSLLHYLILVTFMWFLFRPIVLLLSLIRRNLYERDCFILPFTFMAWALPVIPISIYGVLTFTGESVEDEIMEDCWFESFSFPSYFTYVSIVSGGLVSLCAVVVIIIMAASGYTISGSGYAQLIEIFVEMFLFCGVIATHFVAASQQTDILLLLTASTVLLCGIYFFTANGLARAKLRNVMCCRKDNYFKGIPPFCAQHTPTASSSLSSGESLIKGHRGTHKTRQKNGDIGMDYINDHLYQNHQYRYPFNMWEEMKDGKRVRKPMAKEILSDKKFGGQGTSEV